MIPIPRPESRVLSRRSFLVTAGSLGIAVAFGSVSDLVCGAAMAPTAEGDFRPNAWITIGADGTVSIISPAVEMGQGITTTLPLLVAEELDADWNRVQVVQAPSDAQTYGNPGFYGIQLTGGSESTRGYNALLRLTGAQTRLILLAAAAGLLNVPVSELETGLHRVLHPSSGRSLDYGEIAARAVLPDPLPQATEANLKQSHRWRYIGSRAIQRIDVPSKVNGTAVYGIDVQLPDMLYGAVLRAPVQDERPEAIDDAEARDVPGVTHIVPLPYGVGIVGETVEATMRAKDLLTVTWSGTSRVRNYSSQRLLDEYRAVGRDLGKQGVPAHVAGDAETAIAGAATVIEVDYMSDHVAHATMEPMNATALVSGDRVEIWAPTQGPTGTQGFAAQVAGTTPDKVKVNTTLLGGGFGRKAEADFIIDAVSLAKAVEGRPVKVIWSREDDVRHDTFRPLEAQHVRVGLDAQGNIVGWRHRIVADSIFARTLPPVFAKAGGHDDVVTEGAKFNYAVPAHQIEYLRQDNGLAIGFWFAVGVGYTRFAIECVVDEIAALRGVDPVALRLELLKDQPRARKVIETVARMAEWGQTRDGRGLGLAYADAFGSHCAQVAEVSLNRDTGAIRVHKVWCAIDPGVAIQPLHIEAMMMTGITNGTGHALFEQINVIDGEVQESNFDTYRVIRMSEAPEIEVAVVPTPGSPFGGIGQAGLPPTGPAIANAVARLTGGVRLRHYPFTPERMKAALDS
ncbi:isoquinoline 1-oxidoreductase, beta subunit [Pseudomonas sp. NFIX10]|uniref:xanthine dehydrogenase family protein molybdopterin-binding subunit n=1 Tax=unclassified Pseudomonas TaxID=196821 RepID=UPI0008E6BB3A|nr:MULTISPECIES: molybdopterin cofactor-binding domain-containing protein [unclassified Pseudomonas]SFA80418.1 isoquinoline 1-oxidoreductase, beta subunit [Pseudomonas sp. NFIX10]SFE16790.1 isoquinoline 1-oxidoreductase, beta subunit [Pseudomonas sp. NFACC06-1]